MENTVKEKIEIMCFLTIQIMIINALVYIHPDFFLCIKATIQRSTNTNPFGQAEPRQQRCRYSGNISYFSEFLPTCRVYLWEGRLVGYRQGSGFSACRLSFKQGSRSLCQGRRYRGLDARLLGPGKLTCCQAL